MEIERKRERDRENRLKPEDREIGGERERQFECHGR